MNASTLTIGTKVYTAGFYGEAGEKTHVFVGTIAAKEDKSGNGITMAPYACDGNYMHGQAGMYRGIGQIICLANDAEATAKLDEVVTCENCRKNLGLPEVALSPLASAAVASKKEQAKAAALAAKNTTRRAELTHQIEETEATIAEKEAFLLLSDEEIAEAKTQKHVDYAINSGYAAANDTEEIARIKAYHTPRELEDAADSRRRTKNEIKWNKSNLNGYKKKLAAM